MRLDLRQQPSTSPDRTGLDARRQPPADLVLGRLRAARERRRHLRQSKHVGRSVVTAHRSMDVYAIVTVRVAFTTDELFTVGLVLTQLPALRRRSGVGTINGAPRGGVRRSGGQATLRVHLEEFPGGRP